MEMLTGNGYPSKHLKGEVGQHYKDLETGDIFECVSANKHSRINLHQTGGYIWKKVAHGEHVEVCGGGGSGGGVRPDWSQNDPNAADYVKNRTHWTESKLDVVLPEATIEKKTARLNNYTSYTRNLQQGHMYNVVCDGVEYKCSPVWNDILYGYTIGNASLASLGSDTGEPFFINAHNNTQMTTIYFNSEGQHTIAIDEGVIKTVHTIDPKYLPAGGSGSGGYEFVILVTDSYGERSGEFIKGDHSALWDKIINVQPFSLCVCVKNGSAGAVGSTLLIPSSVGIAPISGEMVGIKCYYNDAQLDIAVDNYDGTISVSN